MSRRNLSVLGKHAMQLLVGRTCREVFHEQIGELVFTAFRASISFWLVKEHLEQFPLESKIVLVCFELGECQGSTFSAIKRDKTKASTFTIGESLHFARTNFSNS